MGIHRDKRSRRALVCALCLALPAAIGPGADAADLQGMLGDVTLDGVINVLDAQVTLNQVLHVAEPTAESDADRNGTVNVQDAQIVINTALGTSGLWQRVQGTVPLPGFVREPAAVALSMDGERLESPIAMATGQFALTLRVGTSWSLAVYDRADDTLLGTFAFVIAGEASPVLPLPEISLGKVLYLGTLPLGNPTYIAVDIRTLLGRVAEPMEMTDKDKNGFPDFMDPLLVPVAALVETLPVEGAAQLDVNLLLARVADCLAGELPEVVVPDLTDADGDGTPDFIAGFIACLLDDIVAMLEENGAALPPGDQDGNGIPDIIEQEVRDYMDLVLEPWLEGLGREELIDNDGDGVPDYLNPYLTLRAAAYPTDDNLNNVADGLDDPNGNGVPSFLDQEERSVWDKDGDRIPDAADVDRDGDGVWNYADPDPDDPAVPGMT